jgi:hypothetical protein
MPILTVTNTNDAGAGSLRDAIARAQSGDTIQFAAGLAGQTITLTSGQLTINPGKNLTIDGAAAAGLRITSNYQSRLFYLNSSVEATRLTVQNLTLANGYSNEFGGAIKTEYRGVLVVDNVQFLGNSAHRGGGAIFGSFEGNVTVTNSTFDGNVATSGNDERGAGAIAFYGPGNLTVRNSTFTNNRGINGAAINSLNGTLLVENSRFIGNDVSAATVATGQGNPTLRGYGGAIYTDRANNSTTIRNSLFENNTARAAGGALYLFNDPEDTVTIDTTILRNNRATGLPGGEGGSGGAIDHVRNSLGNGSFTMTNSSVIGNSANNQGGGLWVNQTRSTITNSTFSGNSAVNNFGGAITTYSPLRLTNTTLANNSAQFSGAVASGSDNLLTASNTIFANNTSTNTGVSFNGNQQTNRPMVNGGGNLQFPSGPAIATGITIADPRLGALRQVGNVVVHPLEANSAAINTGITSGAPTTDARGITRDQRPDIGAFEVGQPSLQINNVRRVEGNTGQRAAVFTVSLSQASSEIVTVDYATANNSAIAGQDYTSLSGRLTFNPNETQKTIRVQVLGDTLLERDEQFLVNLSNASNATLGTRTGAGTIVNDEPRQGMALSSQVDPSQPMSFFRRMRGWGGWRGRGNEDAEAQNGAAGQAVTQSVLGASTANVTPLTAAALPSNGTNGILGQTDPLNV